MVKFQERKMKKRYKRKEYICKKFVIEFPVRVNSKIEPHKAKNFDEVEIASKDTPKQEFLNISLIRNKTTAEINREKL